MVRTAVAVTPNSFCSASRIWYLLASGCTSNAYSFRVWYAAELFSVTTGRTMISCSAGIYLDPFCFFGFGAGFFAAGFLAAGFLAAGFLAEAFFADLAAFLAALAAGLVEAFLAGLAALRLAERLAGLASVASSGSSASGSGMTPVSAPSSTTTASDQRMSYAAACGYGITSTAGMFRPLR